MNERDQAIERVLDVIAPRHPDLGNERFAIFEWGHETAPTAEELRELAGRLVDAVA